MRLHLGQGVDHHERHVRRDVVGVADAAVEQDVGARGGGRERLRRVIEEGGSSGGCTGLMCAIVIIVIIIISSSSSSSSSRTRRGAEHARDLQMQIGSSARSSRKARLRCRQQQSSLRVRRTLHVGGGRGLRLPALCSHGDATLLQLKCHVIAALGMPVAKCSIDGKGGTES